MKTIKEVKNVAVYLRRSRGEEEKDLEKHLLTAKTVCEQNNWEYTLYKEVESGDSIEGRPIMTDLIYDVTMGIYDAVVVTYYDRLGRGSGTDQDIITNAFLNSDTLIIETTPFNVYNVEDDASEEMLAFKQFMARRDYMTINKRLNHGRKMATIMGRWVFNEPYGYSYDSETKKLVIHEEESKVVRRIFDMYLSENYSTKEITDILNREGIPSPKNTKWTVTTVLYLLKSEVYCGHIVYNKSKGNRASKSTVKKKFEYLPKDEWKKVENTHPALKSEDEHDKILEILKSKRTKTTKNNTNVLSGIVKCFNCGKTIPIMKNKEGEDVLSKCYNCGKCRGGQTEIVMESIYLALDICKKHLSIVDDNEVNENQEDKILNEIKSIDKQIEVQKRALTNIENAFEEGEYSLDKFKEKKKYRNDILAKLEDELKVKNKKLKSINSNSNEEKVNRIDDFMIMMKNNNGDKVQQNKLIKGIVSNVVWKRTVWDEVEVSVNLNFE